MSTSGPPADGGTDDGRDGGRPPGGTPAPAPGPWPGGHPDDEQVDALLDADLREVRDRRPDDGTVPPEAQVAAHVLGCPRCHGVLADMRGVRALLRSGGAQAPPPPEDLAARIAAAVADEQDRARAARRAGRRRTALALAAALVVVGGAGTVVVGQVQDGSFGGAASESAGAGGADSADEGAAADVAAAPTFLASGTDYRAGRVADQLDAALRGTPAAAALTMSQEYSTASGDAEGGSAPAAPDRGAGEEVDDAMATGPRLTADDPAALEECLAGLGAGGAVVAVDAAAWEGEPADVLLVGDAGAPADVQVWVVRAGCPGGADALLHYEVVGG